MLPLEQKCTIEWKNEIYLQTCKRLAHMNEMRCSVRLKKANRPLVEATRRWEPVWCKDQSV